MSENRKAFIKLISCGGIWGTIGVFRRYIDLSSGMLAMCRGFIGVATLFVIMRVKKEPIRYDVVKKCWIWVLLSGSAIGINWMLLFESYNYTSVAVSTLCYYMAPVFVILASPFLFKEKITVKKAVCVFVALAGIVLVSGAFPRGIESPSEIKGILLGLGAAVLYTFVIICNKWLTILNAYEKSFLQLAVAAIILLPYNIFAGDVSFAKLTVVGVVMLAVLGILHTGVAYTMYFDSMKYLKAQTVAIFSYVDPVVAVFMSAFVLHENIGLSAIVGGVMVIGAAVASEKADGTEVEKESD